MTGEFVRAPETARALATLPAGSGRVLFDVRRNGRLASVDHVVVGPRGVFVIVSVAWPGDIEVGAGALVVGGESREAAVARVADAALAVADLVPGLDPHLVTGVICVLGGDAEPVRARDVWVSTPHRLDDLITGGREVLDELGVRRTFESLHAVLPSATPRSADVRRKVPAPRVHAGPGGPLGPVTRRTKATSPRPVPPMEDSPTGQAVMRSLVICLIVCSLAWLLVGPLSDVLVGVVSALVHH